MNEDPIRKLLDEQDWATIKLRLFDFAKYRSRSAALAEDLVQTAIMRVYAHDSTWDPAKEPELLRYLMSVVNSILWNERTRASSTRTTSMSGKRQLSAAEAVADPQAFSEDKAADTDLITRRMTLLTLRMAGDPKVLRMIELMVQGVDSPTEIRKITGWSADDVLATRRRMLRAAAVVARDLAGPTEDALLSLADDDSTDDDEGEVA
jgi:DNA-directed RNA polymerase specialized sigma24 family protein